MARTPRDYAAEQAGKNARARARVNPVTGKPYTSHAQYRRLMERGKVAPVKPRLIRSPKTRAAQEKRVAFPERKRERKSATNFASDFGVKISDEDRARDWSNMFARAEVGMYKPEEAKDLGLTKKAYTAAYLAAFVTGDTRYNAVRHSGGSEHLYYWFVTIQGYMEADEYEASYGPQ